MHLFGEKELHEFEVLAIQEPCINRHATEMTTYSQALEGRFDVLLKPTPSKRVCLFINKKIYQRKWTVRYHTRDLSTLTHNMYNPSPTNQQGNTLNDLHHTIEYMPGQHMVVGTLTFTTLHCPVQEDINTYIRKQMN